MDEILIKAGGFLFMIALGFVLKRIGLFLWTTVAF